MFSKTVFVAISATTLANACPGESSETPSNPSEVDLTFAQSADIQGSATVEFAFDETGEFGNFYHFAAVADGARVQVTLLLEDGAEMPMSYDQFGMSGSAVSVSIDDAAGHHWYMDYGKAEFSDCVRAGEPLEVEISNGILYEGEFENTDTVNGTLSLEIPNNADARAFEAAFCP